MDKNAPTLNDGATPADARAQPANQPRPGGWSSGMWPVPLGEFTRRLLLVVLIVAIAWLAWQGIDVLTQAFAGLLFAVFLSALAGALHGRTRLSYGWSLAVVVLGLLILVGGLGWLLGNRLAEQLAELVRKLPDAFKQIQTYLEEHRWGQMLLEQAPAAAQNLTQIGQFSRVTGLISGVGEFLELTIVILVVGIFGAAEPELYKAGLIHLVPPPYRPRARQAVEAVAVNLRGWIVGQVILMIVIGLTTAVSLSLIGVPMALSLGALAGVLELIPYIGAWLSGIPALLMALLIGPWQVLATAALFLGLHILEGYIMLPLIQRRSIHLPPALTIVTQVLFGKLLGLLGLFVAAPLTVTIVVLLKMLYVEDTLGDQSVEVPGEPGKEKGTEHATSGQKV